MHFSMSRNVFTTLAPPTSTSDCQKDSQHPRNTLVYYNGGRVIRGKKHIGAGLSVNHAPALSLQTA